MANRTSAQHADWLQLVHEAGPFLTLPVLKRVFPSGLDRTPPDLRAELRARIEEGNLDIEWVLTDLLEYGGKVLSGQQIPDTLIATLPEHHTVLRPDFAIADRLLVHLIRDDQNWAASPIDRMTVHLRSVNGPELGLVTDGERFTLVWAPRSGAVGRVTWHASVMAEPAERTLLDSFTSVLGAKRLLGVADENTLEALLKESQDAQAEVTKQLGFQVRRAVELLVAALGDRGAKQLHATEPSVVYEAACTVLMRMVILLYAEERRLLPLGDELYDRSYAVSTLREFLQEDADREGAPERLEHRATAWPRLLALFRAVHGGLTHDELRIPAYGGRLFDPDRFAFLEGRSASWHDEDADPIPVDDQVVLEILKALQLLQERGTDHARRLSFASLDVEQIGHVYEGLLDHGARRVDEVICGLQGKPGQEPEVSLSKLELGTDLAEVLLGDLLDAAHERAPSVEASPELLEVLRASVAEAPFTRFAGVLGAPGIAVACVARVRDVFPEFTPLSPPAGRIGGLFPGVDVARFRRLIDLAMRGLAPPLERVQESLGLTDGELGGLFGVSRQAVLQWKHRGVPAERWARLADLAAVVDVLERKLKQGRLPLIARRPAAAFGGRTLLEMVAAGRHAEVRDIVERSLDWSSAA